MIHRIITAPVLPGIEITPNAFVPVSVVDLATVHQWTNDEFGADFALFALEGKIFKKNIFSIS